jgi:hypothetical protein
VVSSSRRRWQRFERGHLADVLEKVTVRRRVAGSGVGVRACFFVVVGINSTGGIWEAARGNISFGEKSQKSEHN